MHIPLHMFSSLTSPWMIAANMIAILFLSVIFYSFHPRKYDTMLIFIVGNMIGLIVRFFVDLEIGVGTGFGLFAIFSLMHFRENYHTFTMVYLFLALSLGILSSLMQGSDIVVFSVLACVIVAVLLIFELFLGSVKKCIYKIPTSQLSTISEMVYRDLGKVKIKEIMVKSIRNELAHVVVTYKKKS